MSPPKPPQDNPHPPTSASDIKRVKLAETMVKNLLRQDFTQNNAATNAIRFNNNNVSFHINLACASKPSCLEKNTELQKQAKTIYARFGKVLSFKHAHVIPWSFKKFEKNQGTNKKEDVSKAAKKSNMASMERPILKNNEYLIHIYAKFGPNWHLLDVILSEDKAGNIYFERFFIIRMRSKMPPGVKC